MNKLRNILRILTIAALSCLMNGCLDLPIDAEANLEMGWVYTSLTMDSPIAADAAVPGVVDSDKYLTRVSKRVLLSDLDVGCELVDRLSLPAEGFHTLIMDIERLDGGSLTEGEYRVEIDDESVGAVSASFLTGEVTEVVRADAVEGVVVIESVDGDYIKGQIHLTFPEGKLRGYFVSDGCAEAE